MERTFDFVSLLLVFLCSLILATIRAESPVLEEIDPCEGLTGRDRIVCRRKLILTDDTEIVINPCAGLRGRRRGKCERNRNRGGGGDGGQDPQTEDNPCSELRGRERGLCERDRNKERRQKNARCAGLEGPEKRECLHRGDAAEPVIDLTEPDSATSKDAVIYKPLGTDRIRFAGNSTNYNGGLVKIFRNNSWGYVCDDDWDLKDANVACRQLGYARGATDFVVSSWYGEAKDANFLMDDVKCSGDETQLQKCSYNINHDCDRTEAAGVVCRTNTDCEANWIAGPTGCYRLFSGTTSRYTAENKCQSINGHLVKIETKQENDFLTSILRLRKDNHYWLTDGVKEMDWMWKSDESPISNQFWFPGWQPGSLFPKPSTRLTERCIVLSNAFHFDDSKYLTEYFYWDNINCNRVSDFICETPKITEEEDTPECYTGIGTDYRGIESETSKGTPCVQWTESKEVNPITHPDTGLGEHNYCRNPDGDTRPWCWINVRRGLFGYCDIPRCGTTTNGQVTTTKTITTPAVPTTTTEEYSNFCPKDEMYCPSSGQCISLSWKCDNENDCTEGEDELNCDYKLGLFDKKEDFFTIRQDPVEVYLDIPIETCARICVKHRKFVCQSFYYESPANHCFLYNTNEGATTFFPHKGYYFVLKEMCGDNDFHCDNGRCVTDDKVCDEYNDCNDFSDEKHCDRPETIEVRLVDGKDEHSGRVEIKYLNEWGIICNNGWDIRDADVICKMLGYNSAERPNLPYKISDGEHDFFLSQVDCVGNETNLLDCKRDAWGSNQCKPHEVVGVVCHVEKVCPEDQFTCASEKQCFPFNFVCDGEPDCPDGSDEKECAIQVKLLGSSYPFMGRVEMTQAGITGTICDDSFDYLDATVLCKMMGYSHGEQIENEFGEGEGVIWVDDLDCTGRETTIRKCGRNDWGDHDCLHEEDVAIKCYEDSDATGPPTTTTTIKPPITSGQNNVECGKRLRAPRTKREERTVSKPDYSRIVGGTNATYGLYPWQVGVRILGPLHPDGSRSSSHWCGATILNEFWVISAAHCFPPRKVKSENVLLRTGDLNGKSWDTYEQSFEVERLISHPDYDSVSYDSDIALIKLKPGRDGRGIKFNDYVQPVCLPPDNLRNSPGTRCEISGWGSTGSRYPSMLKAATVPLLSRRICRSVYRDITPRMMCAGYLEGGIDTCQGDSGGPLVCNIKGVYTLVGITSWGNGCAKPNYPGVYTNVTYFNTWISATLAKYS